MLKCLALLVLAIPGVSHAQAITPGGWDVTSTAVDLDIPGAPGFLLRMMRGKSKTEHKCLTPEQAKTGIVALLSPDPKAKCRIDSVRVEDGHYAQMLSCPQRKGVPLKISRIGTYGGSGFTGRLELVGATAKGAMHVTLDQRAVHTAKCRD